MSWDPQHDPGLLTPSAAVGSSSSTTTTPAVDAVPVQFSIDEAIDRLHKGRFQRRILAASGFCNGVNAMAVMVLSFIRPAVVVEFGIDEPERASWLEASVFVGILFGTLFFGPLGDVYGRKPLFLCSASCTAICSLASGFAPNYLALVLLRFGVGIGVGGTVIPFDILAELTPSSARGSYLLYLGYFWTVGTSATPALAVYALREKESWRLYLVLCSLPAFISTLFGLLWVPESPRWLMTKGRNVEALAILREGARINARGKGVDPDLVDPDLVYPPGTCIVQSKEEQRELETLNTFGSLFLPQWRFMVICMLLVWLALDFIYWGTIQIVALAFAEFDEADLSDFHEGEQFQYDYGAIVSSSLAEIVGQTAVLLLIDRIGRVPCQALAYALGALSVFSLCLVAYLDDEGRDTDRYAMVLLAFAARMFIMAATSVTWVHTAEMLPTPIMNTAHAVDDALAGAGGVCSAFLVSPSNSMLLIGIVMGSVTISVASLTWMLPETRGIALGTAISRSRAESPLGASSSDDSSRGSSKGGGDRTEATAEEASKELL